MKINIVKTILLISVFFLPLSTTAAAQENKQEWQALTTQYHQTAAKQFDAQDNLTAFKAYLGSHSEQALAQLYTASSYCFIARDAWMPWTKMSAVNACIDKMEVALVNAQQQYSATSNELIDSYLTFGLTSANIPSFFQQQEAAQDSLNKAQNHPSFHYLPGPLQQSVLTTLEQIGQ